MLQLIFNVIHRGFPFVLMFCCGSDESWRDISYRLHGNRIATNDAGRCSLKVTLLLPLLSAGKCDRLVNRVADVTNGVNERWSVDFFSEPPDKNFN